MSILSENVRKWVVKNVQNIHVAYQEPNINCSNTTRKILIKTSEKLVLKKIFDMKLEFTPENLVE